MANSPDRDLVPMRSIYLKGLVVQDQKNRTLFCSEWYLLLCTIGVSFSLLFGHTNDWPTFFGVVETAVNCIYGLGPNYRVLIFFWIELYSTCFGIWQCIEMARFLSLVEGYSCILIDPLVCYSKLFSLWQPQCHCSFDLVSLLIDFLFKKWALNSGFILGRLYMTFWGIWSPINYGGYARRILLTRLSKTSLDRSCIILYRRQPQLVTLDVDAQQFKKRWGEEAGTSLIGMKRKVNDEMMHSDEHGGPVHMCWRAHADIFYESTFKTGSGQHCRWLSRVHKQ